MQNKSFYEALKDERVRRKYSLGDIATRSNIPVKVLETLETGVLDRIPGRFYIRSFLRSYLNAVGADEKEFFLKYHQEIDALTREGDSQKVVCFSKLKYKRFKSRRMTYFLVFMGFLVTLLILTLPQTEPIRSWLGFPEDFSFMKILGSR